MRLLLDTVAFIMAAKSPERLSPRTLREILNTDNSRELSSISVTEIATKEATGKLAFTKQDFLQTVADLRVRLLPFTSEHALALFDLPLHHRDPFDRQIIAQALVENIPILTCDAVFGLYTDLKVIW